MSEFFSVTLNKDVVLDDSATNSFTGWTSQHILDQIIEHRITKFGGLDDVNVANKKDKQVVIYSADEQKFVTMDLQNIGEASGLSMNQVSKTGITGSTTTPYEVDIPINTVDFKVPRVNVLKWDPSTEQNVVKTLNDFSSTDENNFETDDMIEFDGTVHLKTNYNYPMTYENDIGIENKEYSCEFDKSIFKEIDDIKRLTEGTNEVLNLIAIPNDRLIIEKNDKDLSYVSNIDYLKVTSAGSSFKIICSIDSGATWQTYNRNTNCWENLSLSIKDIKEKGMSVVTFNMVSSTSWNLLNTNKKIRFAYFLSMDSISDEEGIDNLEMQYDGKGKWIQAKEMDYDVEYASNTQLHVFIKFTGDAKINYQE
ncbi:MULTISPECIES: signal peptidase II [Clostridium]|uniref:signal peptidase II n=1 Tax=Clostridium TaxID=1485 RepID=UPI000824DF9A|nr:MULTISPECIES: signal peptidase II [Clostridium]PJI07027.1 signal peptidase II [Clostridium sp. CT7]